MAIAAGQITIVDYSDVNISTTPPPDPVEDQLWLDCSTVPNVLKRWDGMGWVKASPTSPVDIDAEPAIIKSAEPPGEVLTFKRDSTAIHPSTGQEVGIDTPIFVDFADGKKGLWVEEGGENLVQNGSIEINTNYWTAQNESAKGDNGVVRRVLGGIFGEHCLEYEITSHDGYGYFRNIYYTYADMPYFNTSKRYTVSFWMKSMSGCTGIRFQIANSNSQNRVFPPQNFTIYETWTKYNFTFIPLEEGFEPVFFFTYPAGEIGALQLDGLKLEQKPYGTTFTPSLRAPSSLSLPLPSSGLPADFGIGLSFKPSLPSTAKDITFWQAGAVRCYYDLTDSKLKLAYGAVEAEIEAAWNPGDVIGVYGGRREGKVFLQGKVAGEMGGKVEIAAGEEDETADTLFIGSSENGEGHPNAALADLSFHTGADVDAEGYLRGVGDNVGGGS